jgi:hypothetical protein
MIPTVAKASAIATAMTIAIGFRRYRALGGSLRSVSMPPWSADKFKQT